MTGDSVQWLCRLQASQFALNNVQWLIVMADDGWLTCKAGASWVAGQAAGLGGRTLLGGGRTGGACAAGCLGTRSLST